MEPPPKHLDAADVSRVIGHCYDRSRKPDDRWIRDAQFLEWYHCFLTEPQFCPGAFTRHFTRLSGKHQKQMRRFALQILGRIDAP